MKKTLSIPSPDSFMHMAEGIVYKQVPDWYGADNRALRLNVIRKTYCGPRPTIVFVTGGAWRQVSKNVHVPELVHLVEDGFTVATVEYRSSQDDVFPAQIEDVKAAIRYLRKHADRWCVDPDHIGIMGESAGGHLAAMAGATSDIRLFDKGDDLDMSSAVQAVCDWYGPSDLNTLHRDVPMSPEALLIGPGMTPEKAAFASPVTYVNKNTPPFLILHGMNDELVPISQSEELHDKLTENGCDVTFIALEGARHGDMRLVSPEVRAMIREFFHHTLG